MVVTLNLKNKLVETRRVAAAVENLGFEHDLPIKVVFRVTLALGEVVANVINHGYRGRWGICVISEGIEYFRWAQTPFLRTKGPGRGPTGI